MKEVVRETSMRRSDGHVRGIRNKTASIPNLRVGYFWIEITPEFILMCYIQPPTGASDLDFLTFTGHILSNFF